MEITDYIAHLLSKNGKVNIKGLGSLTLSQADALQNGDGLFPFYANYSFSQQADQNDISLIDYIGVQLQLKREMATYELDKFVIRVHQDINRNGSFSLPAIGILSMDKMGKLNFENSSFESPETFGLKPIKAEKVKQEDKKQAIAKKIGLKSKKASSLKIVWILLLILLFLVIVALVLFKMNIIDFRMFFEQPENEVQKILS